MSRFFYTLLFYNLLPLILLKLWFRGIKTPAYHQRWSERLGYNLPTRVNNPQQSPRLLWVHSVSVGETLAAIPLIRKLQKTYPDKQILVTTMTPTGSERVSAAFGSSVLHCYLPYDLPFSIKRFLRHFQPEILIIMETELWPNLIEQCKRQKIPVIIANARLSEKSATGYRRFKSLSTDMLRGLTIAAQTATDVERFLQLGADPARTTVSGNIKYELVLPDNIRQQATKLRHDLFEKNSLIWIAASTHQPEEQKILNIHQQILAKNPAARLIIVPRHPERFKPVTELCQQQGYRVVRRRESNKSVIDVNAEIFIGDTMGELLLFYAMADVAFVGGSLVATGGHNPLEPAAFSCPVVVGPYTFNFQQITNEMVALGAAVQTDTKEIALAVLTWLDDQDARKNAGKIGQRFVQNNRGALEKLMTIIHKTLLT